ncbi:Asp-tRNA(Asn)/Glu-tRNA(Gln) amidotransferase subunit GatC [Candidatus Woesearchaeota archaeon]|nr:Asp-tRNA(Asn)/Glu-tRNA(Gln) amidotransferase subunit GatC [Candidatus Woesearchaeota archaeon]
MVSEDTIKRVAKLSRLNLSSSEIEKFKKDFDDVLEYFSILEDADVSDIDEVKIIPTEEFNDVLREDIAVSKNMKDVCLNISTHKKEDYFKGPKAF